MADYDSKVLNGAGLTSVVNDYITRLAQKYGQAEVTAAINAALANVYNKTDADSTFAAKVHTHATTDVTGLDTALAGKANAVHQHVSADISDLTATLEPYAKKEDIAGAYIYKGSVATVSDLPTGATAGDVYDVQDGGMNYAWNGTAWDALGSIAKVDLTGYYTKTESDQNFAAKTHTHAEADITGLSDTLATKADKTTVDTLSETVSGHTTQIGTINTTLGTKADTSTVESLSTTVGQHTTQISSINTALGNKADASTVTALQSTVANKADKATNLAGYGITDAYTKTEVDGKIPQPLTPEEIDQIIASVVGA